MLCVPGNATRMCLANLTWTEPDVTNCQSRVFVDIMERVSFKNPQIMGVKVASFNYHLPMHVYIASITIRVSFINPGVKVASFNYHLPKYFPPLVYTCVTVSLCAKSFHFVCI